MLSGIERPKWMMNDSLEDMEWRLEPQVKSYPESHYTLSWDVFAGDNLLGTDVYWRDLARWCVYSYMESDVTKCNKTNSLLGWARVVRSLFVWLCDERKCRRIEDVSRSDAAQWEAYVGSLGVARSYAEMKLGSFRSLFLLRDVFGVGIDFDPYLQNGAIRRRAAELSAENGHTQTIEPDVLFALINDALMRLEGCESVFERLDVKLQIDRSGKGVAGAYRRQVGESVRILYGDIEALYASCLVLIFVLLGQRRHELHNVTVSAVRGILDGDADELVGSVDKTALTRGGRKTARPVIPELVMAFNVIDRLTKPLRDAEGYGGDVFFLRPPIPYSANTNPSILLSSTTINFLLDRFLGHAGSSLRRLRPHMLRRAFSMMWAWRFEVGELHHLSKMLYHNGDEFVRAYTEDEDVFKFLPEAQRELMVGVMEDALLGRGGLYGGAGKAMRRYGRILQAKVSVVTPEAAREFLDSLIERNDYTLMPQADGLCLMSRGREKFAKCSTDGRGPNYANRSDASCYSCVGFGVNSSRKACWEGRKDAHSKVLYRSDNPLVQQAAKEGMDRAESVLRWIDGGDHG
jgi:hypothetical protein